MLSKPRPILLDMPFHIKKAIVHNLDSLIDKMSLRSSFPEFQDVIGKCELLCERVELSLNGAKNRKRVTLRIIPQLSDELYMLTFIHLRSGCKLKIKTTLTKPGTFWETVESERFVRANFVDLAVRTFQSFVENPNFQLTSLFITFSQRKETKDWQRLLTKLESSLKSLKHKLNVVYSTIDCLGKQEDFLKILPYFDPKVFESLDFGGKQYTMDGMDKLTALEQWKNLKQLTAFDLPDNKFPMEKWWNIPYLTMRLNYTSLEDINRFVQHSRCVPDLYEQVLFTNFHEDELMEALGKRTWHATCRGQCTEYPATRTLYRRKITVDGGEITISK